MQARRYWVPPPLPRVLGRHGSLRARHPRGALAGRQRAGQHTALCDHLGDGRVRGVYDRGPRAPRPAARQLFVARGAARRSGACGATHARTHSMRRNAHHVLLAILCKMRASTCAKCVLFMLARRRTRSGRGCRRECGGDRVESVTAALRSGHRLHLSRGMRFVRSCSDRLRSGALACG